MAYCTNCGAEIKNGAKFCPSCGIKTAVDANKSKRRPPPKRKMQKGVVKSLQDETTDYVKSKVKETFTPKVPKEKLTVSNTAKTQTTVESETISNKKIAKKWMLFYFILSFILLLLFSEQEEVMGISFFSVIILLFYWIRQKKEKPFNLLLKIVLILQGLLAVSTLMTNFENVVLAVMLLVPFVFVIIMILFKGNKTQ